MTLRPLRALRRINASLSELERADLRAKEEARVELTRSATAYSRKAREVVDGTMSLSAVLMRAGEVGEAERLLADVERDVRQEKAVLLESVQEAKVATRHRREKMTRLRLAKMVATAFLGGSVFVFSAMGIVAAKYFGELLPTAPESGSAMLENSEGRYEVAPARRFVALGDMRFELSEEQFNRYRELVSSSDPAKLRSFLLSIIPSELAGELDRALAQAGITISAQLAELNTAAELAVGEAREAAATSEPEGSASTTDESSQPNRNDQKKGDDGSNDDDPPAGSSGCEDEDESEGKSEGKSGEHHSSLGIGPLGECLPLLDEKASPN